MPGLAETIAQLNRLRRSDGTAGSAGPGTLSEVMQFGSNPGALRMWTHVPAGLRAGAPLVVALHGCTQTAAAYDHGAGWSTLADRHGFAVLLPEQQRANNPNLCFNWFQPGDTAGGGGEALSIRQMVAHMVLHHRMDPRRVIVTGLSAGGGMVASLLAAYPDVFAGGAIIAGLPAGAATTMPMAFQAMAGTRTDTARGWGDIVRAASPHRGPWPRVQVWQGDADATVKAENAAELVKQWADVHGLSPAPNITDTLDGARHEAWHGRAGLTVLERFTIPGLGHGTPLDTQSSDADHAAGAAGPFMLEAGISSTWHIAQAFGLLTVAPQPAVRRATAPRPQAAGTPAFTLPAAARLVPAPVAETIGKALRAAGLLPGR